jgi:hypothetical protein
VLAGVRMVSVTDKEAHTALAAFSRYGKGRGHPATTQPRPLRYTQWRRTTGRPCCSRAKISTRPTSAPLRDRTESCGAAATAMRETEASAVEAAGLYCTVGTSGSRVSRRSTAMIRIGRSSYRFRSMSDRRQTRDKPWPRRPCTPVSGTLPSRFRMNAWSPSVHRPKPGRFLRNAEAIAG